MIIFNVYMNGIPNIKYFIIYIIYLVSLSNPTLVYRCLLACLNPTLMHGWLHYSPVRVFDIHGPNLPNKVSVCDIENTS